MIPPEGVEPLLSGMLRLRDDVGVVLTSGDELGARLRARLEALGGVFLRKPFSAALWSCNANCGISTAGY